MEKELHTESYTCEKQKRMGKSRLTNLCQMGKEMITHQRDPIHGTRWNLEKNCHEVRAGFTLKVA